MKYYLIAGEASGDLHASNLMAELKRADNKAEFRFFGGDKMAEQGGVMVRHYRELAYMGFVPVLTHLPVILKNMRLCKADIEAWRPDAVILVDYPGFNFRIAKYVRAKRLCKVFYYISPSLWAWKGYRLKYIKRDVDALFSILPFEREWYARRGYEAHYVGNPCVDAIAQWSADRGTHALPDFCRPASSRAGYIAILAGSRRQEIKDNLGMMLRAAASVGDYKLVVAGAPGLDRELYRRHTPEGVEAEVCFGQTYDVLAGAVAAVVTSGTATLETAILGVPQVVCYATPLGPLFSWLKDHLLSVRYVSQANLIAGREIVPELVAGEMTEENIARHLRDILPGGAAREAMARDYGELARTLGGEGASKRAAQKMVELISTKN